MLEPEPTNAQKTAMELIDALSECAHFYMELANLLQTASENLKTRITRAKELSQNEYSTN